MNTGDVVTVTIDRVGAEGDGIAVTPDGTTLFIPNVLPGERITAEARQQRGGGWFASLSDILRTSDARVPPPCVHFGECGGCVLQHWRDAEYRAWKTGLLEAALRRAGFEDPPIEPIEVTPPRSRRRMDLAARRTPRGVAVGLHARMIVPSPAARHRAAERIDAAKRIDGAMRIDPTQRGRVRVRLPQTADTICDLTECHVLHPALFALVAPLRGLLPRLQSFRREASIIANMLDHGIDLLLRIDAPLDRGDRERLIEFARAHRLLRVSTASMQGEPEPVAVLQPPGITLSGVIVEPPPGAFLQASREGESAIVRAVLAALPEKLPARARIAELYAGSGSITFALAQRARVSAWEGDSAAAAALRQATNRSGLAGRVEVAQRDLARQPIPAGELGNFAVVVLDPPFTGAAAQIAGAKAAHIIYVSCNPAVLARDARTLHDAGYKLLTATPVDQFLWSARLESICVFVRG